MIEDKIKKIFDKYNVKYEIIEYDFGIDFDIEPSYLWPGGIVSITNRKNVIVDWHYKGRPAQEIKQLIE